MAEGNIIVHVQSETNRKNMTQSLKRTSRIDALETSSKLKGIKDKCICAVCLDVFSDPRVLRCGHTFCHRCLKKIMASSDPILYNARAVQCPNCRQISHEAEGSGGFPKNFELASLLEDLPPPKASVLLIGCTGTGKSSIGNLLLEREAFKVDNDLNSVTLEASIEENDNYVVIDTVGLCHVEDEREKALEKLVDGVVKADRGVDVILFVMGKDRMTKDIYESFRLMMFMLDEEKARKNLVIVRTHSSDIIKSEAKRKAWLDKGLTEKHFKEIYEMCSKRIVFIENPQTDEDEDQERINVKNRKLSLDELKAVIKSVNAPRFFPELIMQNHEEFQQANKLIDQLEEEAKTDGDRKEVEAIRKVVRENYINSIKNKTQAKLKEFVKQPPSWSDTASKIAAGIVAVPLTLALIPVAVGALAISIPAGLVGAAVAGGYVGIRSLAKKIRHARDNGRTQVE